MVLDAEGSVFCSGHDLKELLASGPERQAEIFHTCSDVMRLVQRLEVPVIAQVQGKKPFGGGWVI